MSADHHYPTDCTDEQWDLLQSLLPLRAWRAGGRGRPLSVDGRKIVNGILYLHKTADSGAGFPRHLQLEHDLWVLQARATPRGLGDSDGGAAPD